MNMTLTGWRVSAFVCASVALSGCCTRYKCVAPIDLVVHNQTGLLLTESDGVSIGGSQPASACSPDDPCSFHLNNTGQFTVTAPGYKPAAFSVALKEDDCGNSVSQSIEVTMVPENDGAVPTVHQMLGSGCR